MSEAQTFHSQRQRLLDKLDEAHASYYDSGVFTGPSLYFHLRALEAARSGDVDRFANDVYALLAAWGMHRMGRGGSKMREYEEFAASLKSLWPAVLTLREASPASLDAHAWKHLHAIFCGIRCMKTGTSLVGNSKVLAHALPNLVAPVDREYTLKFLYGTGYITNKIESEWARFRAVLQEFFYPLVLSPLFKAKVAAWMQKPDRFKWDTSPLKVVDNVMIGLVRHERAASGLPPDPQDPAGE